MRTFRNFFKCLRLPLPVKNYKSVVSVMLPMLFTVNPTHFSVFCPFDLVLTQSSASLSIRLTCESIALPDGNSLGSQSMFRKKVAAECVLLFRYVYFYHNFL